MDKKVKAKWLEALRGGKYRKARYRLRRGGNQRCCLGVLCDVVGVEWDDNAACYGGRRRSDIPPTNLCDDVGLTTRQAETLANLNDKTAGWDQAIKLIEARL